MFCTKCGAQLPEDAEFCTKCGTKLKGAASEQTVHGQAMPTQKAVNKNRNKIAKPFIIAALLLCIVGAVWYSKSDVRQNLLMDAGAKAVSEQNFAKALKCYQKLYKMDNQSEELYLFGADVYLAQDRWEDAIRIIEEGIALTGSERLKNRLGYICENVVVVSAVKTEEDGEVEFEFEYDKWGNLINVYQRYSYEEFPVGIKLEHDNKGNLTKKVYYTDKNFNGIADDWEYDDSCEEFEYDNKGNVISFQGKYENFEGTYWAEYEYDKHGNRIKDTEGDADGISCVTEYDKVGNAIKWIGYHSDGSISLWNEYEYDNRGNLIKNVDYDSNGNISRWREYGYDSHGNLIKDVCYDGDGNRNSWVEYDKVGNVIKWICYHSDGSISLWYEYEYDSHGNEIKEIIYNNDGSISYWDEYEYDSHGNQIKYVSYDEEAKVTFIWERELNAAGFCVKENDYYVWDTDGEETEPFREYTWEHQFTYAGDILCCNNITPLSGVIKFVQGIPSGTGTVGDNAYYGALVIMKRKPSNQSPYSLAVYFDMLDEEAIGKDSDIILKNMLTGDYSDEIEWEVIGETTGYYQLANGWYVAKDQPGIIFTGQ